MVCGIAGRIVVPGRARGLWQRLEMECSGRVMHAWAVRPRRRKAPGFLPDSCRPSIWRHSRRRCSRMRLARAVRTAKRHLGMIAGLRRRILGMRRGARGGWRGCGPCLFTIRLLTSFRSVPFGHALWMDGIHKVRSWLRSVMCAQKPRVRFEMTSSTVAFSRRPFRKRSMELRFSRLTSLTWPRLFFPRMGRLTGDVSSNSQ